MFEIEDDGVKRYIYNIRGSMALATNGDARNTYFDGIEVVPYDPNYSIVALKEQ